MKFLAVIHMWFIDNKGFELRPIEAESRKEAEMVLSHILRERNDPFVRCEGILINDIPFNLNSDYKLSLKERITGKLDIDKLFLGDNQ